MNQAPPVTVLLYHEILPAGEATNMDVGCIPIHTFEEHLDALEEAGFENILLQKAIEICQTGSTGLLARGDSVKPKFAVTFDDGYANLHPLLMRMTNRSRPTLFVIQDYLGKSNLSWNPRAPVILQHLTLSQVHDLESAGVDLQTHGPDHHNLVKFDRATLTQRLRCNIDWFETQFGHRPSIIAYPYGAYNDVVRDVVAQMFKAAVSVNHGAWDGPEARYGLNRISVPSYLSGRDLVAIIQTAPEHRWIKTENLAPWRNAWKHDG